jgi:hypothetical protein
MTGPQGMIMRLDTTRSADISEFADFYRRMPDKPPFIDCRCCDIVAFRSAKVSRLFHVLAKHATGSASVELLATFNSEG